MYTLRVRNVHDALPSALGLLRRDGVEAPSRNGPVLVLPEPLTTIYERPTERVIFHPGRNANPFFHLMESLWMLAGRRDVKFVADLVPSMANFSDDGKVFNAAYGYRWRRHFSTDQLRWAISTLTESPDSRRVVIGIWDGDTDPDAGVAGSRDLPCNLAVHLQRSVVSGALDMTVFNRSNDIVWGAYGANAVHFSMLQEFVARSLGWEVGRYWQVSDNWHAYQSVLDKTMPEAVRCEPLGDNPYATGEVEPYPIMSVDRDTWLQDLDIFMEEGPVVGLRDRFFRRVAGPMWMAYRAYKKFDGIEKYDTPLEILEQCLATDWRRAGEEWIIRRREAARVRAEENPIADE